MDPPQRLGDMLLEAGLVTAAQLRAAVARQRVAKARLGSTLVAMGVLSEEALMDFLSRQTGVPRLNVRLLDVPEATLRLIPQRLAEQFTMLPVAVRDPKSLVLAMADPSDLEAVDSACFASGHQIEPVVASHSALKAAMAELYRRLDQGAGLELPLATEPALAPPSPPSADVFPRDPFFTEARAPLPLLEAGAARAQGLDAYPTRTLVLGLVKLLQRRGVITRQELPRLLASLEAQSAEAEPED